MSASTQPPNPPEPKDSILDDWRELLVDFGLPALLIIILSLLLAFHIDGEVKTLLAAVVGWIVKSGYSRTNK